jgi:hypothetical protein
MKIIIAAMALAIAWPASAQSAPADPHAQHNAHRHGQQAEHGHHGEAPKSDKHKPCDMSDEDCKKACADMHARHEAEGGEHAGHKPKG